MGKSRTLADTVSTGGPLADGVIGISDVTAQTGFPWTVEWPTAPV